jgi:hypothetical protein
MKMLRMIALSLTAMWLAPALAATDVDYKAAYVAAYAKAEAANKEAGQLRNQWTVTATALSDAKRAADVGDLQKAIWLAEEAELLAKASAFQAKSEKERWKDEVIR